MHTLNKYGKPLLYLTALYLVVNTLLRIILLLDPQVYSSLQFWDYIESCVLGLIPNLLSFAFISIPFVLYLYLISDKKLNKPYGQILFFVLILLILLITCTHNVIKDYGSVLINIVVIFLGLKLLILSWLLWGPKKYRDSSRRFLYGFTLFVYTSGILINALSEYFFWKEFGMRYNFIAVDYLIYTNEVIGNIMQSYPVVPLFSVLGLIALALSFFIYKKTQGYFSPLPSLRIKLMLAVLSALWLLISAQLLPGMSKVNPDKNLYLTELKADGMQRFYQAFKDNNLSYNKFYAKIPQDKANDLLSDRLGWPEKDHSASGFSKTIKDSLPEIHKNIVLITVESLSASYLAHYGNTHHLTPFLDSLSDLSLNFTNLYAVGNRTVRGLEALTLCIPPMPAESVIKQKDNKNKFTTGHVLKQKGYQVQFLYGGYSYFDNMKDFYEGNGYQVIDRSDIDPAAIHFANIWGVADEDMASKLIEVLNTDAQKGSPFFAHWMTVSNHRPFTYPDGRISIPGDAKSRNGGVMYTDYALHQFFTKAASQPWFKNTVFVIVADHCASSAGKVALPVDKYRIPCIVYSPGFIVPREDSTLMSQIDIMPTVFGLLHFSYPSKFIGEDVFSSSYQPRAFMATYEDLGYLNDSLLTVLSPVRQIRQYSLIPVKDQDSLAARFRSHYEERIKRQIDSTEVLSAISYYQSTSWLLHEKKLDLRP